MSVPPSKITLHRLRHVDARKVAVAFWALVLVNLVTLAMYPALVVAAFVASVLGALWLLWSREVRDVEVTLADGELRVDPAGKGRPLRVDLNACSLATHEDGVTLRNGPHSYRLWLPADDLGQTGARLLATRIYTEQFRHRARIALTDATTGFLALVWIAVAAFLALFGMQATVFFLCAGNALAALATLAGTSALLVPLFRRSWRSSSVIVGADGVLVERRGRKRFLLFGELADLSVGATSELVAQRERGPVTLRRTPIVIRRTGENPQWMTTSEIPELVERFRERVAELRVQHRVTTDREPGDLVQLARGDRSIAAWRQELARPVQSFREAALSPDQLVATLADPQAPVEQRIGAALALRDQAPDGAHRVRIAALETVDPQVRVALETVAAEEIDEARLEAVLGRCALR